MFRGEADEIEIVPVEELYAAVGPRRPGERRYGVDDELDVALVGANRVLRALLLVDVVQQHTPPKDASVGTTKRKRLAPKPAIHAVRSAEPLENLVGTTGGDRSGKHFDDVRQVLWVNDVVGSTLPQLLQ